MSASRSAWIYGAALLAIFLCGGCATPKPKPLLSTNVKAEALSYFSMSLLAESAGNFEASLSYLKEAIQRDPTEMMLYPSAVAVALQLEQSDEALRLARQFRAKRPNDPLPRILEAQICALTDRNEEAEALLRQTRTDFPGEIDSSIALARFLIMQKKNPEAIRILEAAQKAHPDHAEILHMLGTLYVSRAQNMESDPEKKRTILEGITLLEDALSLSSENPQHWQQLGYVYLAVKDTEKAQTAFEKALELFPANVQLARQLLDIYILNGEIEPALALCEELQHYTKTDMTLWVQYLVEKTPKQQQDALTRYLEIFLNDHPQASVVYYAQLGSLYIDQNKLPEAASILQKARELYPENDQIQLILGYLNLQQEDYEKAYRTFKELLTSAPDSKWVSSPLFILNFIIASQKSDRLDEATEALSSAYSKDPEILNLYVQSLVTGQTTISTQSAIDLLSRFYTRSPDAIETLYYLSLLQADQKKYDEAISNAQRFEELAIDQENNNLLDGFFYYQYAILHERTGKLNEAEMFFRKAIELGNPSMAASAQNYIAYMWAERGEKLDMGLELIRQALLTEPGNAAYIDTLGWIYYMQGRYQEALEQLKKASELMSTDPTVWEHLGDTYLKLGDLQRAVEHWKKGLEIDPGRQTLIERLEENGINADKCPAAEDTLSDTPNHP
jgi:tetratricopeptide (TPR) repeat protein